MFIGPFVNEYAGGIAAEVCQKVPIKAAHWAFKFGCLGFFCN